MTTSTIKGTPGLVGKNTAGGDGVWGDGTPTGANLPGRGVVGFTTAGSDGVWGESATGRGVVGVSTSGAGVWGETIAGKGVVGISQGASPTDIGVFGKGVYGGYFEGRVKVTGDLYCGIINSTMIDRMQTDINDLITRIGKLEKKG